MLHKKLFWFDLFLNRAPCTLGVVECAGLYCVLCFATNTVKCFYVTAELEKHQTAAILLQVSSAACNQPTAVLMNV